MPRPRIGGTGPPFHLYRGAVKSLARPTSRFILFDGENISFDASLVLFIYLYIYIYIYIYTECPRRNVSVSANRGYLSFIFLVSCQY